MYRWLHQSHPPPSPPKAARQGGTGVTEVRKDSLGNLPGFVDKSETCSAKSSQWNVDVDQLFITHSLILLGWLQQGLIMVRSCLSLNCGKESVLVNVECHDAKQKTSHVMNPCSVKPYLDRFKPGKAKVKVNGSPLGKPRPIRTRCSLRNLSRVTEWWFAYSRYYRGRC